MAGTEVETVRFAGGRAVGVVVRRPYGTEVVTAEEVILAAGALRSPMLLMRSGVGPPDELARHNILVRAALPGVGRNLHDHPFVAVAALLRRSATQPRWLRPVANMALRQSSGLAGCPPHDVFLGVNNKVSWHALGRRLGAILCCLYKPFSRGAVTLDPDDPMRAPVAQFNLLADERDVARLIRAVRLGYSLATDPAVEPVVRAVFAASFTEQVRALNRETFANRVRAWLVTAALDGPASLRRRVFDAALSGGTDLGTMVGDDDALAEWLRGRATGFFHPVGTCRIGREGDPAAVVDSAGRVHGVAGLRVCDASLMPFIVSANTNIPTIMIAEKVAEHILESNQG